MCGRTSLFVSRADLEERFDAPLANLAEYRPRYNIAPTDPLAVLHTESAAIESLQWGLPGADGRRHINARIETVADRPTFQDAWDQRPCLIPSSGFYEWGEVTNGAPPQPYRIYRPDDVAFAMAGIWEPTERGGAVAILTQAANDVVSPIHDRMPVVLSPSAEDWWMDASPEDRQGPKDGGDSLETYPVDPMMNSASVDDPSIIEPLDHEQSNLTAFEDSS